MSSNCDFTTFNAFSIVNDTQESQRLLKFQNHKYNESMEILGRPYKKIKPILRLVSPLIRGGIEKLSTHK
jgi:uncharacterized protein (DUF1778 family)